MHARRAMASASTGRGYVQTLEQSWLKAQDHEAQHILNQARVDMSHLTRDDSDR